MNKSDKEFKKFCEYLREMRDAGYSVCVFAPFELEGANPRKVADRMCEAGWDAINWLKD